MVTQCIILNTILTYFKIWNMMEILSVMIIIILVRTTCRIWPSWGPWLKCTVKTSAWGGCFHPGSALHIVSLMSSNWAQSQWHVYLSNLRYHQPIFSYPFYCRLGKSCSPVHFITIQLLLWERRHKQPAGNIQHQSSTIEHSELHK